MFDHTKYSPSHLDTPILHAVTSTSHAYTLMLDADASLLSTENSTL